METKLIKSSHNTTSPPIGEEPYRFIILITYCLLTFSSGFQWVTYAAISVKMKKIYDLSQYQVDLYSMLFMITFPFLTFPSSYMIDNKNLKYGVIICN